MNITRSVILDLLPAYLAGEASEDTRALVEAFARGDPEIAAAIAAGADALSSWPGSPGPVLPPTPPDSALLALRRTRRLLALRSWLFGFAMMFSGLSLTTEIQFDHGRITSVRWLPGQDALTASVLVGVAASLWVAYFVVRGRAQDSQV